MKFNELKISDKIKDGIKDNGFTEMMPIQEATLPIILKGKNIVGEAETGTGKTAAFVIPAINMIDTKNKNIEVIIVTPTRELAMQIVSEIKKIGKYMKFTTATLVGGMAIRDQIKDLTKKPNIIVGTLGRINDHIRSKRLDLSHVKLFVLDEADEMLKEGFKEDITTINNLIPDNKQTLLFSATISKQILKLSENIMDDYEFITVKDDTKQSVNIKQYYILTKEKNKFSLLTRLLDVDVPSSAIIFGRTKRRADELSSALVKCGYKAGCIHGDLSQIQRNNVIKKFKNREINILVATDVAARGLDINDITHVYNFDLPQEVEFYIHRIGRTGRANKEGVSYSFIKEGEIAHIDRIRKETKIEITEKELPEYTDVWEARNKAVIEKIEKKLSLIDTTKTKEFAVELIQTYGAEKIASVLIETLSVKKDINSISLTGEPPVKTRGGKGPKRNYSKKRSRGPRKYSKKK